MTNPEELPDMLPGFGSIQPQGVMRAEPQPRNFSHDVLQPDELRNRPFNEPFRGQLQYNVERIQEEGVNLDEILTDHDKHFLSLCITPQGAHGHWMTESEIKAQVTGDPKIGDFRRELYWITVRVWRRWAAGERAIELLKPEYYLYRRMIHAHLKIVDEIPGLSAAVLKTICPSPPVLAEFTARMRGIVSDYHPPFIDYDARG